MQHFVSLALLPAAVLAAAPFAPGPDAGALPEVDLAASADAGLPDAGADGALASGEPDLDAADGGVDDDEALEVPQRLKAPPLSTARPLPLAADLRARMRLGAQGRYVLGEGDAQRTLTLEPRLQDDLVNLLRLYQTPYAAVVVLEPATGRVLAMAEHSEDDPAQNGLCTRALYPAASIFKLVTASALVQAGVGPEAEICFHGGKRRLSEALLEDSPRDSRCETLASALANSANVAFAKLTLKHLDAARLSAAAEALRFNRPLPFPVPVERSLAAIPEDRLGLANAGAGFGDVWLSPLHGAALAGALANGGVWKDPVVLDADLRESKGAARRVLPEEVARAVVAMMGDTVTSGTARRIFRERGYGVPGAVGKTGSLADKKPFRDYTWFVGFAPQDAPKVAVAAVVVNGPHWRIRATWLGREALRLGLGGRPFVPQVRQAQAATPDAGAGGLPAAP